MCGKLQNGEARKPEESSSSIKYNYNLSTYFCLLAIKNQQVIDPTEILNAF